MLWSSRSLFCTTSILSPFSPSPLNRSSALLLFCSQEIVLSWASCSQVIKPPSLPEPELLPRVAVHQAEGPSGLQGPVKARHSWRRSQTYMDFDSSKWHRTILKSVTSDMCSENSSLCTLKRFSVCYPIYNRDIPLKKLAAMQIRILFTLHFVLIRDPRNVYVFWNKQHRLCKIKDLDIFLSLSISPHLLVFIFFFFLTS